MAGKKIKLRISGSSLIEVLIAMVVIVVVFSLALVIVTNVTRSSLNVTKAAAEKILDKAIVDAERLNNSSPSETSVSIDGLIVNQKIGLYNGNPALTEIQLAALSENGDTILTARKVVASE